MPEPATLQRAIRLPGAVMMGLGSIVGTGVFVSLGIAAGVAGANVLPAIFCASLLALCNGLSSAQLAANHPVSGGTYEYGYRWLSPSAGFFAGWLFLFAKSASAATAALGLAGYAATAIPFTGASPVITALVVLATLTLLVFSGIRRTSAMNSLIVVVTLVGLAAFVAVGFNGALRGVDRNLKGLLQFEAGGFRQLCSASALMFVAYTGYGRIATLGEEVTQPRTTIPRAMVITLILTMALYLSVGFVAVGLIGPAELARSTDTAPLLFAARSMGNIRIEPALTVAALTAMLGVLLNLILGLSRVVLAMARRGDMPAGLARVNRLGDPWRATLAVALLIGALIMIGDVRLSWSFSALTVLCYYAITNLAALRVEAESRLFPRWISVLGLLGCAGLAFTIAASVLWAGCAVVAAGFVWRFIRRKTDSGGSAAG